MDISGSVWLPPARSRPHVAPSPYIVKTPILGGSLIFQWFSRHRECDTAEFNRLQVVGRLEGRGHALTAHCWTHLKLIDPLSKQEIEDALIGRIKGDFVVSGEPKIDIFGNRKQEQTVSLQFAEDLIFAKMALFR